MDKEFLRQKNIILRRTLNRENASKKILSKILTLREFLSAENILIFYPLKNEINLLPLLNTPSKNFFLPRVRGLELEICPFKGKLIKNKFKIMEPETPPVDIGIIELAFIPALAVDKNLNRIGYGKGFYDRLFKDEKFKAIKIAVINKELTLDLISADEYDRKVDLCITD